MNIIEKIREKYGCVKAAFYGRFSTEMQRDESIDAQLRAVKEYAIKNDIIVIDEYIDKALSGKYDNRPNFQKLISDAEYGRFNLVLVHKLDRFARRRCDSIFYRTELKKCSVTLISVTEHLDDSPESIILESVLEGIAEYYSRNLSREVMKGLKENAFKGLHCGGIPPLGYDLDNITRRLVINEYEAQAVRIIFQRSIEGIGYNKIVQELNAKGFKTKIGNNFSTNSIYEILHNEKYVGTYVYNKCEKRDDNGKRNRHNYKHDSEIIRVENAIPPIISKEIFDDVQTLMKNRKKTSSNRAIETYLLTGKVFCGVCGGSYVGTRKLSKGKKYISYECNIRHRHAGRTCDNKCIKRDDIEDIVLLKIKEIVNDYDNIKSITDYYNEYFCNQKGEHKSEISSLNRKIKDIEIELKKIAEIIIRVDSETLIDRLLELENNKRILTEQKKQLENCEHIRISENDIQKLFAQAIYLFSENDSASLKRIINIFVDKILVYPDNIEVYFNFKKMIVKKNNIFPTVVVRLGIPLEEPKSLIDEQDICSSIIFFVIFSMSAAALSVSIFVFDVKLNNTGILSSHKYILLIK